MGEQEVEVGNDIYGNPIKRIKYEIKQIKVRGGWDYNVLLHVGDINSSTA